MTDEERAREIASMILSTPRSEHADPCGACEAYIAFALAAVHAEERAACAEIAARCAAEREAMIETCRAAGGAVEALEGKASEARRIAEMIRGRKA